MKEVALKTINYKTIDANSPAFVYAKDFSLEVISYEFSVKSCFFDVDMLNKNLKMTIFFLYMYRVLPYIWFCREVFGFAVTFLVLS